MQHNNLSPADVTDRLREALAEAAAAGAAREAAAKPLAEKVITQYQRGLLTLDELAMALIDIDLEARGMAQ